MGIAGAGFRRAGINRIASMAKPSPRQPARTAAPQIVASPIPAGLRLLGASCLLVAIAAAFVLALDHFAIATPPGCGPQSGCDRATRSIWGTIPGIDWPTSLAGVAYFTALLVAWLASPRAIHPLMRITVWAGVIGSLLLTGVMLRHGYLCKYCLATHVANIAFLGVMELAVRRSAPAVPGLAPIAAGALAFVIATAALAVAHQQTTARRLARSEAELRSSTDEIARRSAASRPASATTQTSSTQAAVVGPTPPNAAEMGPPAPGSSGASITATAVPSERKPFTGRWRLGPENAPIRIVMFMDYQCEDCQMMESQAAALLTRRSDVSLSVKHFPMCADCNRNVGGSNMHPNACWAARAAETAGILKGNDAFWQMHNWLFQRHGSFTDVDFPPALQQLGYDPNQFIQTMMSNVTLQNVLADIDEGASLGLHFTPLIFINGVELRGFIGNPGALTRAVDDLAARNLPPGTALNDQPVRAADKYIEDWRAQPQRPVPADPRPRTIGDANAKVVITVWGDLQDRFTAELDRQIQEQITAGKTSGGLRYDFRLYPADQSCNTGVQRTIYPMACVAARAAEAAASVSGAAGDDSYWKMHNWLLAHQQQTLSDDLIRQAAGEIGLDPAAVVAAMNSPEVIAAVGQDISGGAGMVINGQIPTLYINGKWVPRWKLEGANILERLIEAAASGG